VRDGGKSKGESITCQRRYRTQIEVLKRVACWFRDQMHGQLWSEGIEGDSSGRIQGKIETLACGVGWGYGGRLSEEGNS